MKPSQVSLMEARNYTQKDPSGSRQHNENIFAIVKSPLHALCQCTYLQIIAFRFEIVDYNKLEFCQVFFEIVLTFWAIVFRQESGNPYPRKKTETFYSKKDQREIMLFIGNPIGRSLMIFHMGKQRILTRDLPMMIYILHPRRCKTSSVGQSAGLFILRSSVRFWQKSTRTRELKSEWI